MAKLCRRIRRDEQVATVRVSIVEIMSTPTFTLGVADARAGRRYHRDYDRFWDVNGQWGYERGRQWGTVAPPGLPLRRNGKINPEATRYFTDEII